MSIKVTVNTNMQARAEAAAKQAAEALAGELFASMQQSFTAKAWEWPGTTERGGGSTVGSPRNIIDVGNLRQSGSYRMVGPYKAEFRWSAAYATAVHEGYRRFRADGSASSWPARPWTDAVLGRVRVPGIEPFPLQQRLRETWLAYFRRGRR